VESVEHREQVVEDQDFAFLVTLTMYAQTAVGQIRVIPGKAKKLSAPEAASGEGEQNGSFGEVACGLEHSLDLVGVRAGGDAPSLFGAVYEVKRIVGGMAEANSPLEEAG